MQSILILTADPSLGRFDRSAMSEQTCMEMLVEKLIDVSKFRLQDAQGGFLDIAEWFFVDCDADGHVIKINTIGEQASFTGEMDLLYLPTHVGTFAIPWRRIRGTLDTQQLPQCLDFFDITQNRFEGPVDFTALPASLTAFKIGSNRFHGSCDLRQLPPNLEKINVSQNKFAGTVDLDVLPPKLSYLDLGANQFEGNPSLTGLPRSLAHLYIPKNLFQGEFRLTNVPEGLRRAYAMNNAYSGCAVIDRDTTATLSIDGNYLTAVVDEHGEKHALEEILLRNQKALAAE